jgi:hypothetical protein
MEHARHDKNGGIAVDKSAGHPAGMDEVDGMDRSGQGGPGGRVHTVNPRRSCCPPQSTLCDVLARSLVEIHQRASAP